MLSSVVGAKVSGRRLDGLDRHCSETYFGLFASVFFFKAEDGIRDLIVTGVQTCALPISPRRRRSAPSATGAGSPPTASGISAAHRVEAEIPEAVGGEPAPVALGAERRRRGGDDAEDEIGRASCRERV